MRVLLVTRAVVSHRIGGLERHARDVAEGLAARGHTVEIWTTAHPEGLSRTDERGVATTYFPNVTPGAHSNEFKQAVLAHLSEVEFDVLLSESNSASLVVERLSPPNRPPAIAMEHGTQISEALSVLAADQGPGKWHRAATRVGPAHFAGALSEGRFLRCCERVMCVSEYVARQIEEAYGVPPGRLRVVRNGIPLPPLPSPQEKLAVRRRLCLPAEETILLCSGRLAPDKGFGLALQAFAAAQTGCARVLVVGSGPEEERLRQITRECGIAERVTFTGGVPQDEMAQYYAASDILLLPSVRFEGHPYVLIEGAVPGLAVIASDRGGLGSELAGRDMALLVRPGCLYELTDAMRSLLTNPELRATLGARLRAHAERYYTLDAMLDGVERVIREAIAEPGA